MTSVFEKAYRYRSKSTRRDTTVRDFVVYGRVLGSSLVAPACPHWFNPPPLSCGHTINFEKSEVFCTQKCWRPELDPLSNLSTKCPRGRLLWTAPNYFQDISSNMKKLRNTRTLLEQGMTRELPKTVICYTTPINQYHSKIPLCLNLFHKWAVS